MTYRFEGVDLVTDISPAEWIPDQLDPWDARPGVTPVTQIVPGGFEAYARVFHPARLAGGGPLRWDGVARWSGRTVHPEMQFAAIAARSAATPPGPPPWDARHPEEGNLEHASTLAGALAAYTETRHRCWFALWEGYGGLGPGSRAWLTKRSRIGVLRRRLEWWRREKRRRAEEAAFERIPKLRCENRAYLLYRGPIEGVDAFRRGPWRQSPNLWWPDDRSWCVATEIDLDSTLVGGTRAAVAAVLTTPELEALPIAPDMRVDAAADEANT